MNKRRRQDIIALIERAQGMKAVLDELRESIETIRDEEQDYFDAMSESLQDGEKGSAAEEVISHLDAAVEAVDEVDTAFDEVVSSLESAAV